MTLTAVHHIRRMRGGSQSHMMLCDDDNPYVVKFQNNPQGIRVLANEMLATRLAGLLGLSVAPCEVINVDDYLIDGTPELKVHLARGSVPFRAGLQLGSRVVGGIMPGLVFDHLDHDSLSQTKNIEEFAGVLAFDKWSGNIDGRQAVFSRRCGVMRFKATFIDHGHCFCAEKWTFEDAPLRGVYGQSVVYRDVAGWDSFQPWLERIETLDPICLWKVAGDIPPEWYAHDVTALNDLVQRLLNRRERVRELLVSFATSDRQPFPKWRNPSVAAQSGFKAQI